MHRSETIENRLPPCAEAIRDQLGKILGKSRVSKVGRGAAFLSYIVEEALAAGQAGIKGYSIALEVFKRDEGFSQEDPVVRIEAGRLRRVLERYYLVAGQTDPIRIEIPKGGYVPVFRWSGPQSADAIDLGAPAGAESHTSSQPWWKMRPGAAAGLVTLAVLTVCAVDWITENPANDAAEAARTSDADRPTLVIERFVNLGGGAQAQLYTVGLTEELLTALPRFKEIEVFDGESPTNPLPEAGDGPADDQLGERYSLAGGVRVSGDRMRVSVRLLDTDNGAILWSQTYDHDLRSHDLLSIQADIANRVATSIAEPYGIMAQQTRTDRRPPLPTPVSAP